MGARLAEKEVRFSVFDLLGSLGRLEATQTTNTHPRLDYSLVLVNSWAQRQGGLLG